VTYFVGLGNFPLCNSSFAFLSAIVVFRKGEKCERERERDAKNKKKQYNATKQGENITLCHT
jgi:hypothetical protein